jgi:hypothetical protein
MLVSYKEKAYIMKHVLSILFFTLSSTAFAQKFQIALNAGVIFNTNPMSSSFVVKNKFGSINWYGNIKGLVVVRKWQFGFGLESVSLKGTIKNLESNSPPWGVDNVQVRMANPALVPNLITNYKINIGDDNYIYIGLSGGYMFTEKSREKSPSFNENGYKGDLYLNNGKGLVYGSQLGITHSFGKRISMNMELGIRKAEMKSNVAYTQYTRVTGSQGPSYLSTTYKTNYIQKDIDYSITYIPLSIGVRYKL